MEAWLGLFLFWLGALYLALVHPLLPGWAWGLGVGGLALALYLRRRDEGLFWTGMVWAGWAIGAAFADLLGLTGLKLVGAGLGLFLAGDLHPRPEARSLGLALALAGLLVGLFEVGAAPWVGAALLVAGLALLYRPPGGSDAGSGAPGLEARYRRLLAWRKAEAERRGTTVDAVLSDAAVAELARIGDDPKALRRLLGRGREADARAIEAILRESPRG